MAEFLSQQFSSLMGGLTGTATTQTTPPRKKFRSKILDLYDQIFLQHKDIKSLECNVLHLKVHRSGLYQFIRKAMSSQQDSVSMFNRTFQYCINSLLDDSLLVVKHAFQAGLVFTHHLLHSVHIQSILYIYHRIDSPYNTTDHVSDADIHRQM